MTTEQIRARIRAVRRAIRHHRNQRGDDRCWIDDKLLYAEVLGLPDFAVLPNWEEFLRNCTVFHERRRGPSAVGPARKPADPAFLDDRDLEAKDAAALKRELDRLIAGVRAHFMKAEKKVWLDDEHLYLLLPERDPGDLTHPDELLANCHRFYDVKAAQVAGGHPLRSHDWSSDG